MSISMKIFFNLCNWWPFSVYLQHVCIFFILPRIYWNYPFTILWKFSEPHSKTPCFSKLENFCVLYHLYICLSRGVKIPLSNGIFSKIFRKLISGNDKKFGNFNLRLTKPSIYKFPLNHPEGWYPKNNSKSNRDTY